MEIRKFLHLVFISIIYLILLSCNDNGDAEFRERLICGYRYINGIYEDTIYVHPKTHMQIDFSIYGSIGKGYEYDSLSTYFKDLDFNSKDCDSYYAISSQLDSITIISDSDFDEKHPKGTSLNDLVTIKMRSFYNYTSNNYVDWELTSVNKKLSELTESDGKAIDQEGFGLDFPTSSQFDKEHNLTLSFYFKNKEPMVIKRKMIFE